MYLLIMFDFIIVLDLWNIFLKFLSNNILKNECVYIYKVKKKRNFFYIVYLNMKKIEELFLVYFYIF